MTDVSSNSLIPTNFLYTTSEGQKARKDAKAKLSSSSSTSSDSITTAASSVVSSVGTQIPKSNLPNRYQDTDGFSGMTRDPEPPEEVTQALTNKTGVLIQSSEHDHNTIAKKGQDAKSQSVDSVDSDESSSQMVEEQAPSQLNRKEEKKW